MANNYRALTMRQALLCDSQTFIHLINPHYNSIS